MKRKNIVSAVLSLIVVASLGAFSSCEQEKPQTRYNPPSSGNQKDTASYRLLFIGNSFTVDAVYYLPQILAYSGITNYTLKEIYYPGRTLPEYVSKYYDKEYTLYTAVNGAKFWTTAPDKVSIAEIVGEGNWDVVTLQEHTGNSLGWSWSLTEETTISTLMERISGAQASGPAFYWVLSQAYFYMSKIGTGSQPYITWPKENTKEAQLAMYNVIVTQGKTVMEKFPSMAGIIATGTTLQNLRTCPFNNNGWDQTRDGYHMDMGTARYGAACTVAGTLFKDINLNKCTFRILGKDTTEGKVCTPVDDSSVSTVVKAARNAIEKPFEITDMSK